MKQKIISLLEQLKTYHEGMSEQEWRESLSQLLNDYQTKNYYELMGFSIYQNVNPQTLRQTYLKLAMFLHPDKNRGKSYVGESEALFKIVLNAYHTLGDQRAELEYREKLFKNFENHFKQTVFMCCIIDFKLFNCFKLFSEAMDVHGNSQDFSEVMNEAFFGI